jgi:hypothetical protein
MDIKQIKSLVKIAISAQEKLLEAKLRLNDSLVYPAEFQSIDNAVYLNNYLSFSENKAAQNTFVTTFATNTYLYFIDAFFF